MFRINRREFIKSMAAGIGVVSFGPVFGSLAQDAGNSHIQTVLGPIKPDELGLTLIHEHVMVDFIGADEVNKDRYDPDEVVEVMQPYLEEIKALGVNGFAECTPMFLARDPEVLARLSKSVGMHIITNTGMYKEPYLPQYAFEKSAQELADMWIHEARNGIENTGIKPGFVKIAVNPGSLIPIQQKIVRAAARTSLATGLVIASHTGHGVAALETMDILEEEGLSPESYIFVHAGSESNQDFHFQVAERGAWVEYDHIGENSAAGALKLIKNMLEKGYEDQLLLSQDAGWYNVGQPKGGNIRGFGYIISEFMPMMVESGIDQNTVDKLMITNPAKALTVKSSGGAKAVSPGGKAVSTFGKVKGGK
ncbi:phosphotriesterase [Candidatus Poribacteria bacterium]|nr:phosphotriesterase [Candidatus Poribacteria bacterium]